MQLQRQIEGAVDQVAQPSATITSRREFELLRRIDDLERQVVALSRAPMALSQQVNDLKDELRMTRLGAKGRLTEDQIRQREKDGFSEGKKKCDRLTSKWIEMRINEKKKIDD